MLEKIELKDVLKVILVCMFLYSSQLAMYDSDRFTFENRLIEAIKFMELNTYKWRDWANDTVDPHINDETGRPLEADFRLMRLIASPVVIGYG